MEEKLWWLTAMSPLTRRGSVVPPLTTMILLVTNSKFTVSDSTYYSFIFLFRCARSTNSHPRVSITKQYYSLLYKYNMIYLRDFRDLSLQFSIYRYTL